MCSAGFASLAPGWFVTLAESSTQRRVCRAWRVIYTAPCVSRSRSHPHSAGFVTGFVPGLPRSCRVCYARRVISRCRSDSRWNAYWLPVIRWYSFLLERCGPPCLDGWTTNGPFSLVWSVDDVDGLQYWCNKATLLASLNTHFFSKYASHHSALLVVVGILRIHEWLRQAAVLALSGIFWCHWNRLRHSWVWVLAALATVLRLDRIILFDRLMWELMTAQCWNILVKTLFSFWVKHYSR